MINIIKIIIVVIVTTFVSIWVSNNDGYVMFVLSDKLIKMNIITFVLIMIIAFFSFKIIKFVFKVPLILINHVLGLFISSKKDKYITLLNDIMLGDKKKLRHLSVKEIIKITPSYLEDIIVFLKLELICLDKDVKKLEESLIHVKYNKITHQFFGIYKFYLVQKFSEALTRLNILLEKKDTFFMPNIIELASNIALDSKDDVLALRLLNKYKIFLKQDYEERLIILSLQEADEISSLLKIYKKFKNNDFINTVYLEKLLSFDEVNYARKFAKKQLNGSNLLCKMLCIYVNVFNFQFSDLTSKVLSKDNKNYDSILTLLDLSFKQSDHSSFNLIKSYIDSNIKDFLCNSQSQRYSLILSGFSLKDR